MNAITIFGCGWLGKQIALSFLKEGNKVFGSNRSKENEEQLMKLGVIPFEYHLSPDYIEIDTRIINETSLLVLSLPPLKGIKIEDYAMALQNIVLQFHDTVKVIFTSSTGIYPQKDGNYNEDYAFDGIERLNELYLAEKGLKSFLGNRLTILRLGGLIGPNRHPIKYLSGRLIENNGSCPVSLVDSRDVVRLIHYLQDQDVFGEIFNISFPVKLSKSQYYSVIAKNNEVAQPIYGDNKDIQRDIRSTKISEEYNFQFIHDITSWKPDAI